MLSRAIQNIRRFRNPSPISAVHDEDLTRVLKGINLLGAIEAGTLLCSHCRLPVTLDNLAGWRKEAGGIILLCNRPTCSVTALIHTPEAANG